MTVDLGDLVEVLQREVSPPGTNLFPNATSDDFLGQLQDAFWEGKLFGFFQGFAESDGEVDPISTGAPDLSRDWQQLIVLFAGARILRNELRNLNTSFHAEAGAVVFEQQKSAQLLRDLLEDARGRITYLVQALAANQTFYIDAVIGRQDAIDAGATQFVTGRGAFGAASGNWGNW